MARISGVDLPGNKRIEIGLTYVYGIGRSLSNKLLEQTEINRDTKVHELTDEQVASIRKVLEDRKIEGDLRREVNLNIKRLMDLGNYRGLRHRRRMPVRGQNTKNNARTRKGPRRLAVAKKK